MNKLLFKITNKGKGIFDILIYDSIGVSYRGGITASFVLSELKKIDGAKEINLRVNSPGGDVFEGIAIYNVIRRSSAIITTYIDGIAASMGSIIALAGSKVYMSSNARFMTHRVTASMNGDATDFQEHSQTLTSLEDTLAGIYATKTGLTVDQAKKRYMQKGVDKWMTANEALKEKLIDGVIEDTAKVTTPLNASPEKAWKDFNQKLSFKNRNMDLKATLINKFKLTNEATDEEIIEAVDQLHSNVNKIQDDAINNLVDEAIRDKKINFSQKPFFVGAAKNDLEATRKVLDLMPKFNKPTDIINRNQSPITGKNNVESTSKDKSQWTLNDWRKNAPNELRNNPELFNSLIEKEK